MITSYMLILCASALFAAYTFTRIAQRVYALLGTTTRLPEGLWALAAALAFLVVVSAPSTLILSALLLFVGALIDRYDTSPLRARWWLPLVASLLALSPLVCGSIAPLPPVVMHALAVMALYCLLLSSVRIRDDLQTFGLAILLPLLPLALAPLMVPTAPSYLALDSALVGIAVLGALLACRTRGTVGGARAPLVLLVGWLMVEAALHGAWLPALASIALYAMVFAATALRPEASDAV